VEVVRHPDVVTDDYLFGGYQASHDALYEERGERACWQGKTPHGSKTHVTHPMAS
jgi:hypothetical protein